MRQGLIGLGLLIAATTAGAGSWTCSDKVETLAGAFYVVLSRCSASGTYTTAGDPVGDGSAGALGSNLCNSSKRSPRGVLVGNTANAAGAETYVATWDQSTMRVMLATAAASPTTAKPLAQLAIGTSLAGFTLRMLAVCQ